MVNVRLMSGLALSVAFAFKGQYTTAVILSVLTVVVHYFFRPATKGHTNTGQRKCVRARCVCVCVFERECVWVPACLYLPAFFCLPTCILLLACPSKYSGLLLCGTLRFSPPPFLALGELAFSTDE